MDYNKPPVYVSGSLQRLRRRLRGDNGVEAFKENVKGAVNKGIDDFITRLETNQIAIDTVADFEKLVKLGLLVHDEPTEIIKHDSEVEVIETEQYQIISSTPEFESLKNQIALMMNERNEKG